MRKSAISCVFPQLYQREDFERVTLSEDSLAAKKHSKNKKVKWRQKYCNLEHIVVYDHY
jgi:hypothetical protein